MKKYIVTEHKLVSLIGASRRIKSSQAQHFLAEHKELPPGARVLTETDLYELYRHWKQLDYGYLEGIAHVIGEESEG